MRHDLTPTAPAGARRTRWYGHLYAQVLVAIALGTLVGHFWPATGAALKPLGDGFISLVKMVIAPVIFLTVVSGIAGMRELGAVGQKYFGAVLCLDANNTVLLLNEMELDGLVVRKRDPADRRRHVVELTEAGLHVLHEAEASMSEIEDSLLAALDDEQRKQFRALLHQTLYGASGVFERRTAAAV